jgi:hypothetical protein
MMTRPILPTPASGCSGSQKGFIDQVLWPEFSELNRALQIIREEVYSDTSEAEEVPEALPLN